MIILFFDRSGLERASLGFGLGSLIICCEIRERGAVCGSISGRAGAES